MKMPYTSGEKHRALNQDKENGDADSTEQSYL